MGELPDWYLLIRAARYLQTTPWELAKQSEFWVGAAMAAQNAEIEAENFRHEHHGR